MIDNKTEIRRSRIAIFLSDHPSVGYDKIKTIAEGIGVDPRAIENDLNYFKKKYREENKKYNLEGIFKRSKEKLKRLEELQKVTADIIKGTGDDTVKLHAVKQEEDLINSQFLLESDGLVPISEELEDRELKKENEKLENKSS